ncbi:hypothetical protein [Haliea sp.]
MDLLQAQRPGPVLLPGESLGSRWGVGPLLHWSQPDAGHSTLDINPHSAGWREVDRFPAGV